MANTSTNIDPMNNSLKLTLNNIIDSYFEKDEADFNILSESNIDSLYYGIDDLHKCDVVKRNHNILKSIDLSLIEGDMDLCSCARECELM